MELQIKLDKDFERKYEELTTKYGEELNTLNGFANHQLNYTDFIDNFIDKQVVADASIDGNSNVAHKDIVSLMNEMAKPHQKLLSFNKIYYEIKKEYGVETADNWLEAEIIGKLYMHDSNTTSFVHYCYKGEETLMVKYKDTEYDCTFVKLYNLLEEEEEYDVTIDNMVKRPTELYVKDYDNEKICWTKVTRVVKHDNDKEMRLIRLANGLTQTVTCDHPVITDKGEIPASEVNNEHKVLIIENNRKPKWVEISNNEIYERGCKEVYDITTETGHFLCNLILSHNCYAYDLKDLAERGLFFINESPVKSDNLDNGTVTKSFSNEPPKHLGTFVDFVKEFVSWACNRSSGGETAPVCFFSANRQGYICS